MKVSWILGFIVLFPVIYLTLPPQLEEVIIRSAFALVITVKIVYLVYCISAPKKKQK